MNKILFGKFDRSPTSANKANEVAYIDLAFIAVPVDSRVIAHITRNCERCFNAAVISFFCGIPDPKAT
jgi:hypothetical protein